MKYHKGRKGAVIAATVIALAAGAGIAATSYPVKRTPRQANLPQDQTVGIAKGTDHREMTLKAIDLAGGLEGIVKPGGTVLIKPNVVGPSPSGAGRITDWRIVQAVVDKCIALGAGKVIVGEAPVDRGADYCFEIAGYRNIKGAPVVDLSLPKDQCYYIQPDSALGMPLWIPKIYMDADTVIDVSILKTHNTAGVTMSLKNVGIGIPSLKAMNAGGWKEPLHKNGVNRSITDVNLIRRPDFSIIDATVAGERNGPVNPTAKRMDLVLAGRDPVAVDTIGTVIMGFDPEEITHIVYAAGLGVGTMDQDRIKVRGEDHKALISPFRKPDDAATVPWIYKRTGLVTGAKETPWVNRLDKEKQVRMGKENWTGPKDLSGSFTLVNEGKALLITADITDDKAMKGDALGFMFSIGNPFEESNGQRGTYEAGKDFRFVVDTDGTGKSPVLRSVFPSPEREVAGAITGLVRTDSGYRLKATIPLKELGLKELPYGTEFWFDLSATDADEAGVDPTKAYWSATNRSEKNPTAMGRVLAIGR